MKSIAALTVAMFAVMTFVVVRVIIAIHVWLYVAVILMSGAWGAYKITWIIRMGPQARKYLWLSIWAKLSWRYLMRHLSLGYVDPHKRKSRLPFGPAIGSRVRIETDKTRITTPRVKIRPDSYGIVCKIKTVARTGRQEYEDQAQHLADFWRCGRVSVSQPKPGRLLVKGFRNDPLYAPLTTVDVPAGIYSAPDLRRLYVGKDEIGQHRYTEIKNNTAITCAGLPGAGKSNGISGFLKQWSVTPSVQFAICNGKDPVGDGGDYGLWLPRAFRYCGDDVEAAADMLEGLVGVMNTRLGCVYDMTGSSNGWMFGPCEAFPLLGVIVDESQEFLDSNSAKQRGDKEAEKNMQRCAAAIAKLVRKGRSAMVLLILATQRATVDSIPGQIRDNAGISLALALKTVDASVAALGSEIRQYPSYMPTTLQGPEYRGCAITTMRSGEDPYTRLRMPQISEDEIRQTVAATSKYTRDPAVLLPTHLRVVS